MYQVLIRIVLSDNSASIHSIGFGKKLKDLECHHFFLSRVLLKREKSYFDKGKVLV